MPEKMSAEAEAQYGLSTVLRIAEHARNKRDELDKTIAHMDELCEYLADRIARLDKVLARIEGQGFLRALFGRIFGKGKGGVPMK